MPTFWLPGIYPDYFWGFYWQPQIPAGILAFALGTLPDLLLLTDF